MIAKRHATGFCSALYVLASLAGPALAAPKKGGKDSKTETAKGDEGGVKGGMMEEEGKDPALTEGAEEGQFSAGKKAINLRDEDGEPDDPGAADGDAPKKKSPAKPRKTIGAFGEVLIGLGEAPVPGPANATTGDATSIGLLVGGHFDLTTDLRLLLRVPWTTATVEAGGESRSASALGSPEIAGRLRVTPPGDTEVAVRVGVGVPVAQGNPDPTNPRDAGGAEQAAVQRLANSASGRRDPELYAPKRLSLVPSVHLTHRTDLVRFGAEAKLMLLQKVGGEINAPSGNGGTYELNSLAASALLGGTASYEAITKGHVALAAWASYTFVDQVTFDSSATDPSAFQLVLEPKLIAQFGRIVPSAGVLLPVGGELGGKMVGIRLHVDAVF